MAKPGVDFFEIDFIFVIGTKMFYDWSVIRTKHHAVEYAIYSYFDDGSFDDVQDVVCMNTSDSISDYIRTKYGATREDRIREEQEVLVSKQK